MIDTVLFSLTPYCLSGVQLGANGHPAGVFAYFFAVMEPGGYATTHRWHEDSDVARENHQGRRALM